MKVTLRDTLSLEDKMLKVKAASRENALKLIFGWVKSDNVDFGSFLALLSAVRGQK